MYKSGSFKIILALVASVVISLFGLCQSALATTILSQDAAHVKQKQESKSSLSKKSAIGGTLPSNSALSVETALQSSVASDIQSSGNAAKTSGGSKADVKPENSRPAWLRTLLEAIKVVVSWPFIVLAFLIYFVFFRSATYKLARLLKPFRSLKLFGAEFVLNEEVGADAEQAIEIYRKQVKRAFDTLVEINDIRAKLEVVIGEVQAIINRRTQVKDLRCTLHVPDILFADTLYQLLDYYPLGGGRGRTFSSRFGIIGLCWRSREDQIQGAVPTQPKELILNWGMTQEQAMAAGGGRESFLAVLLCDEDHTSLAIFYMDAKEKNVFGADKGDEVFRKDLTQRIRESAKKGLVASLVRLRTALTERMAAIDIHPQ
jgi:hypothetical protein